MKTIIVATKNPGKIDEYRAMFAPYGFCVESLLDHPDVADVEETGATFAENALLKAQAVFSRFHAIAVADDSGLVVDALGGAPGVRSQRYSAEGTAQANNKKLLSALSGVDRRNARFVCTIVVLRPDASYRIYQGALEGEIALAPRGTDGFGYDPLFDLPELGRTVAELDLLEKNQISHRGRAFAAMMSDRAWWDR